MKVAVRYFASVREALGPGEDVGGFVLGWVVVIALVAITTLLLTM